MKGNNKASIKLTMVATVLLSFVLVACIALSISAAWFTSNKSAKATLQFAGGIFINYAGADAVQGEENTLQLKKSNNTDLEESDWGPGSTATLQNINLKPTTSTGADGGQITSNYILRAKLEYWQTTGATTAQMSDAEVSALFSATPTFDSTKWKLCELDGYYYNSTAATFGGEITGTPAYTDLIVNSYNTAVNNANQTATPVFSSSALVISVDSTYSEDITYDRIELRLVVDALQANSTAFDEEWSLAPMLDKLTFTPDNAENPTYYSVAKSGTPTGAVVIPSTYNGLAVTTIGSDAFKNCSGLTSIAIPSSVTTIGNAAFQRCSGLTSIAIPSSVTTIGDHAFAYCTGLTSVTIDSATIAGLASSDSQLLTATKVYVKNTIPTANVGAYITGSFTLQGTSDKTGYWQYNKN